jgi:hypothetical protein
MDMGGMGMNMSVSPPPATMSMGGMSGMGGTPAANLTGCFADPSTAVCASYVRPCSRATSAAPAPHKRLLSSSSLSMHACVPAGVPNIIH